MSSGRFTTFKPLFIDFWLLMWDETAIKMKIRAALEDPTITNDFLTKVLLKLLQSFTSEERLRSHSFEHSSLGECAYCNQNFGQDLQRLLNHLDSHHNYTKTALHCQNCPKSFRFISDLQNHKCIGQDATNPMLHATENFFRTFSESYTPIFQQSLPRISYQCPLCPKVK
ncbi:unnamed protein product [Dracunculus medinensis]|uniref:C2H2-type domain-containing protein n=1 Tax=Dracunculus medinensis TaxID=318479 RepID=A0A0N4U8R0_DRAME|nr:unnamed protein product [Dracunculus medinensis]